MIFSTKNNEFAILGNTIDDLRNKLIEFNDAYERSNGHLLGTGGVFNVLHDNNVSKNIITNELLNDFEAFKDLFNDSSLSAEALAESLGGVDDKIVNYAKTCKNGELTTKGFTASLNSTTLGAKAASAALKGVALVGNIIAGMAISFAITSIIKGIDYLIRKEEKLKEALEDSISAFESTASEIENLEGQVKSLADNIAELQKLKDAGTISIADDEELRKLKEENDELERQIALLQDKQIREGKEILKNIDKQDDEYVQSRYSLGNNVTPSTELQLGVKFGYEPAINSGNESLIKEHGERIVDMYEKIQPTIEAYRSLEEAGYNLSESEQKHFDELKKGEDAYLMYTYLTNGTKEAFVALNEEMQKTALLRNLIYEKGLTKEQADAVLENINPEDYVDLYDANFIPPSMIDYPAAKEYGKAYAEAWLEGIEEGSLKVKRSDAINKAKEKLGVYYQDKTIETFFDTYAIDTEEEINRFNEIVESSTSAAEAIRIYKAEIARDDFLLSEDDLEKVKEYQDQLSDLYEALSLIRSGNVTQSDKNSIMEKFPELTDDAENLEEAIISLINNTLNKLNDYGNEGFQEISLFATNEKEIERAVKSTTSAIDEMISSYETLNDVIEEYNKTGKLSLKTFQDLMAMKPQYLNALIDENGQIRTNIEAYKVYLKLQLKEYEIAARKEAWSIQKDIMEKYRGRYDSDEYKKEFQEAQIKVKTIEDIYNNFDEVVEDWFKSGSSSTSDFEEQIDWAANSVSNLEREVTNLENALADTKVWDEQIVKIEELNKALGKVQTGYSESEKLYREEYNSILSSGVIADQGLSNQIREKIESGEVFDIEDFIDKNIASGEEGIRQQIYNAIQKALDYFNKANDAKQNKVKIKADIEANDDQIKEIRDKQYQFDWDDIKSKQQATLDTIDYNGGKGTAEQYDQLIDYENQLMEMEQERLKELEATLRELEPSTDEYKEQVDLINESNNRLAECKRNIKDWGLEKINRLLDTINNKLEEINEQIDANQDAIDAQDRFIAGAIGILNQEIEVQEELRDTIQDKIDALQKENDEHERALALEKAKYELERARSQRTVKLYSGEERGFIYTQNEENVRSAQENLDQLEFEATIHALEEQVEYYDKIIENLNEIKDTWSEIASKAQEMLDIQYTLSIGGAGIRDAILGGTYDVQGLTNSYKNLLAEGEMLESQKKTWEDFYAAIETAANKFEWGITTYDECFQEITGIVTEYSSLLEITQDEVDTVVGKILEELGILADPIDETKKEIDDLEKGTEEATDAMEGEIKDTADVARDEAGSAASDVTEILQTEAEAQKEVMQQFANDINATFSDMVSEATSDALGAFQALADGITSIASTVQSQLSSMVSQAMGSIASMQSMVGVAQSLNNDILEAAKNSSKIVSTGSRSHSSGRKTIELKSNGGMLTTKDKELEQLAHSLGEDHITLLGYKEGERVLTPVQNEIWEKLIENAPNLNTVQPQVFTPTIPKVSRIDNTVPVVQNVNLTLPNVTNENGYNKIISAMKELQMDAVQFSKKK